MWPTPPPNYSDLTELDSSFVNLQQVHRLPSPYYIMSRNNIWNRVKFYGQNNWSTRHGADWRFNMYMKTAKWNSTHDLWCPKQQKGAIATPWIELRKMVGLCWPASKLSVGMFECSNVFIAWRVETILFHVNLSTVTFSKIEPKWDRRGAISKTFATEF